MTEREFAKQCLTGINPNIFTYPSDGYKFKHIKDDVDTIRNVIGEESLQTILLTMYTHGTMTAYGRLKKQNIELADNISNAAITAEQIKTLQNTIINSFFGLDEEKESLIIHNFNQARNLFHIMGDCICNLHNQLKALEGQICI